VPELALSQIHSGLDSSYMPYSTQPQPAASAALPVTARTRITRAPERQRTDRAELYSILDEALVAHVAIVRDALPLVLPMGFGRGDDAIYLHGSTGSGIFRAMASGTPISVTVTHLDGLVYARSLFDSSMNYRSAVVFGVPSVITDAAEKWEALRVVCEHLMPGRFAEVRDMTKRELAATLVLRLPLDEVSVKVRAHGASEAADDGEDRSVWCGVLPLRVTAMAPETSALTPPGTPVSAAARAYAARIAPVLSGSGSAAG